MDHKKIWSKPKYLPYVQTELTDKIIQQTEQFLGYKLPQEYLNILKIQNGGYIAYSLEESPHRQIFGIGSKFPNITNFDIDELQTVVSFNLDGLIPFDGDGYWYLCFDYRNNTQSPCISLIDIECDQEKIIAKDFAEYLALLQSDCNTDTDLIIHSKISLEQLAIKLERLLDIKFEHPDSFAQGYPVYQSRIGNNWLWLHANQVPIGFIREGETNYEDLKHLMKSYTLKFSELDQYSYILQTLDEKVSQQIYEKIKLEFNSVDYFRDLVSKYFIPR